MKHLYRCILYLLLICLVVTLTSILFLGMEKVGATFIQQLGLVDKQEALLELISNFSLTLTCLILFLHICLICLGLYKQKAILGWISDQIGYCKDAFSNLFSSLKVLEIFGVLAVPFIASIYFGSVIAVSYDEAITYNFFTIKPFYYCMIFYPYPNNHVLHSLLTNVTEYFPFVSALFAIRIPAIVASMLTWLIGYSFLKKYYSSKLAIVVVGVASVCYMSIYYSFMSRGYAFMVLAFVVCMYAAFNIIHQGSKRKDWMFFVVSGVLGCYTIPSFLYPFATLNLLILVYNYRNIKHQVIANIVAGVLVLLLYAPIMIVDGVEALASNQFVQPISRLDILQGIPSFYRAMFADIAGTPYWTIYLMALPLVLTVMQKDKKHLVLWAIFMLAPFVLIFLHAVNPFYRTFLYYNFATLFLIAVPFQKYLNKVPMCVIVLFIVVIQLFAVYKFDSVVRINEGFNTDAAAVSEQFFKEGQTIVFPCIASANYEFEANVRGLSNSIRFLNNEKANADTINNCDYVIMEVARDLTVVKKPYYSTSRQSVYKNSK